MNNHGMFTDEVCSSVAEGRRPVQEDVDSALARQSSVKHGSPFSALIAARLSFVIVALPALLVAGCGSSDDDSDDGGTDTGQPSITASLTPAANPAGWHNSDVTVSFECADADSGIATCPDPVLVDTEGEAQSVSGTAVDQAGNSASVTVTVNLDKTAPALSGYSPSDGATVATPGVNLTGTVGEKACPGFPRLLATKAARRTRQSLIQGRPPASSSSAAAFR